MRQISFDLFSQLNLRAAIFVDDFSIAQHDYEIQRDAYFEYVKNMTVSDRETNQKKALRLFRKLCITLGYLDYNRTIMLKGDIFDLDALVDFVLYEAQEIVTFGLKVNEVRPDKTGANHAEIRNLLTEVANRITAHLEFFPFIAYYLAMNHRDNQSEECYVLGHVLVLLRISIWAARDHLDEFERIQEKYKDILKKIQGKIEEGIDAHESTASL